MARIIDWLSSLFGRRRPGPVPSPDPGPGLDQTAALFEAHNRERAVRGLAPLRRDARLDHSAQKHAQDMARRQRLDHMGSDGSSPGARLAREGYAWSYEEENIAAGQLTAAEVMASWMASPPHRADILSEEVTDIGLGMALALGGAPYWCVDFARP